MKKDTFDCYLTPAQTAQALSVSLSFLAKLRSAKGKLDNNGKLRDDFIPFIKIGAKVLYPKYEIRKMLKKRKIKG